MAESLLMSPWIRMNFALDRNCFRQSGRPARERKLTPDAGMPVCRVPGAARGSVPIANLQRRGHHPIASGNRRERPPECC